jgi:hypothetical protein
VRAHLVHYLNTKIALLLILHLNLVLRDDTRDKVSAGKLFATSKIDIKSFYIEAKFLRKCPRAR